MRLRVVRSRNWKGDRGYRWRCNDPQAVKAHPSSRPIEGFSADLTSTASWRRGSYPSALSRAMDGARKHLIRYHQKERSS
jgi:hypothetical protein